MGASVQAKNMTHHGIGYFSKKESWLSSPNEMEEVRMELMKHPIIQSTLP